MDQVSRRQPAQPVLLGSVPAPSPAGRHSPSKIAPAILLRRPRESACGDRPAGVPRV